MRLIRDTFLFIVIAIGLGLSSAYFAINHADQLERFEIGPWRAWPNAAGPDANPYMQARQSRSGAMPIGNSEGLAFEAVVDNDGTPLDGNCQYRITGGHIPARLWTLGIVTDKGHLVINPSQRYGYHSQNVAWHGGGTFEIVTGPEVLPGNWLKTPNNGSFRIILRLYQTPLTSGGGYLQVKLPDIEWMSCR